ncbi:hypothetical protein Hamer_G019487 [Homarus americanus]|uniref:Uncharacterized protein n=1 Tax=Homarus americanus TaxID=6706 RepID=A0A8J5JM02_HOMAM|nr:hypothetical protein Hamer_G019487 [Homarus americanus]
MSMFGHTPTLPLPARLSHLPPSSYYTQPLSSPSDLALLTALTALHIHSFNIIHGGETHYNQDVHTTYQNSINVAGIYTSR